MTVKYDSGEVKETIICSETLQRLLSIQIGGNIISHLEGHRVLNKKCCKIFSERVGVLIVI